MDFVGVGRWFEVYCRHRIVDLIWLPRLIYVFLVGIALCFVCCGKVGNVRFVGQDLWCMIFVDYKDLRVLLGYSLTVG